MKLDANLTILKKISLQLLLLELLVSPFYILKEISFEFL